MPLVLLGRTVSKVQRESEQASGQKLQTMISVGATLMGALMGRKAITASTLNDSTVTGHMLTGSATLPWSGELVEKSVLDIAAWIVEWNPHQASVAMAVRACEKIVNKLRL